MDQTSQKSSAMQISSLSFHNIIIFVDNLKRLEGVFIPGKPVNCYFMAVMSFMQIWGLLSDQRNA